MDKHPLMKMYIGDKHLSSWSMRPWLLMKQFEIPFQEQLIRLDQSTTKKEIAAISPTGRVPLLEDHDIRIWDSMAICEYLAEKFPRLNLWPDHTKQRAWARSICQEMHSSFVTLRSEAPHALLNLYPEKKEISAELQADVERIDKIFNDCREAHKSKGDFLFGAFGIADAYFMPVISRFRSYQLPLRQKNSAEYFNHILNTPLFKYWVSEAEKDAK